MTTNWFVVHIEPQQGMLSLQIDFYSDELGGLIQHSSYSGWMSMFPWIELIRVQ